MCIYTISLGSMFVSTGAWRSQMHLISRKLKLQPAVCHPMWGLGTKLGSSARASALTHWSISSASSLLLRKQKLPYSSNYFTFLSGIPNILFPFSYQKQQKKKKQRMVTCTPTPIPSCVRTYELSPLHSLIIVSTPSFFH